MDLHNQLSQLSPEELLDYACQASIDQHTGYILGSAAVALHPTITPGRTLVYVDFCCVHACNHLYDIEGTNARWIASFEMRAGDIIIKWGGDEIAVLLDDEDVTGYLARLTSAMHANGVYAIIAVVITSTSLKETIGRADTLVNAYKLHLDSTGQRPHRNDPYICLSSHIIYEET